MKNKTITIIIFLFLLSFAVNDFAKADQVNVHGFISQGYMQTTRNNLISDSTDGTFQFNEMGINFGYQPLDKLLIGIQFFARDLGSVSNDEIQVDYAVADYRFKDYFGLRGGRMKNPMGVYSEYRDIDMLRTCILLPYSVYDENLRDSQTYINGVGIYGDINTEKFGSISYQALVGTNNIEEDSATALFLGYGLVDITSVDMDTTFSYSLQYSDPTGHIRTGGTAFFTDLECKGNALSSLPLVPTGSSVDIGIYNIEIYTAFCEFTWERLVLTYEFKYSKVRNAQYRSPIFDPTPMLDMPIDQIGRYVMLTYRLTDFLSVCVYNDVFYPYRNDRKGHNPDFNAIPIQHWSEKWALAIKMDLNDNWILKLETHYTDGAASTPAVYNDFKSNLLPDLKEHWWLYAVKLSFNF